MSKHTEQEHESETHKSPMGLPWLSPTVVRNRCSAERSSPTWAILTRGFSNPPPLILKPTSQVDREEFSLWSEPETWSSFRSWNKLQEPEVTSKFQHRWRYKLTCYFRPRKDI
ncbi:hypothetical protein RvY_02470 [Ramazzottius varieornatus]|uniref:Uncharacterized protein n=1 Tax=Ramazzottius varieornatus TaxID=947166 RepID=A0A1D1UJV6_RAMVA|nr:hypothetical protein RvY_02470 [Ramazzottius varieornatus]